MLLVTGWGLSVLLVANLPLAERLGHALFDGQLYFVEREHLIAAWLALGIAGGLLLRLSRTPAALPLLPPTSSAPADVRRGGRIWCSTCWLPRCWRSRR